MILGEDLVAVLAVKVEEALLLIEDLVGAVQERKWCKNLHLLLSSEFPFHTSRANYTSFHASHHPVQQQVEDLLDCFLLEAENLNFFIFDQGKGVKILRVLKVDFSLFI